MSVIPGSTPAAVRRALIAAAIVTALPLPVEAQRGARLSPEASVERWLDKVPVSGGLRVGVMAAVADGRVDPVRFRVLLPRAAEPPRLCVEVSSRDGRYEAKHEYDLTALTAPERATLPGWVQLEAETEHARPLSNYSAESLAILARLSADCDGDIGPFVLATWSDAPSSANMLVYVNSRVPTFIVAASDGRVLHEARCTDLPGTGTAYNLQCAVPASWVRRDVTLMVRKRERRGSRSVFVDVELPLLVPAGGR